MSGSLAARYIAGLPYDPALGVGQYSRAPRASAPTGTETSPALTLPQIDATGQAVRVPAAATVVNASGAGGGGVAGGDMLLAAALGLLPYLPDAYNAVSNWMEPGAQAQGSGFDGGTFAGPGGVPISNAALGGLGTNWDSVFEPGSWSVDDAATRALLDAPMPAGDQFAGAAGAAGAGTTAGGWGAAIDAAGGFNNAVQAGTLPLDFGMTGSLGSVPGLGDVATGGADILGGLAGSWIAAQPFQDSRRPYAGVGQQLGSVAGGLIGQAIIPVPFLGAAAGAAIGGLMGGGAGSQIGPAPTIGRNFGATATIGPDGQIQWSNTGGDNGGTAADADAFANWFSPNLQQQAAAQGLAFNPNMAGVQFNVGGYDNFSRRGPSAAGGYFYDPILAGSPENYALRPSDDFASNPFSFDQANSFATNVLADLAARGVYTPNGADQPGRDYYNSTLGAPLGWYGANGGDYNQVSYGGSDFNTLLGARQGAINGFLGQQQQDAAHAAAGANTFYGGGDNWGAYDLSQPIWFNGGLVNPADLGITTPTQQQQPFVAYQEGS